MKNIYELSSDEKNKLRKKFNKLSFTKDINLFRAPALFASLFGIIFIPIAGELFKSIEHIELILNIASTITILSIILYAILEIYLNISFLRWLKIKNDIEY